MSKFKLLLGYFAIFFSINPFAFADKVSDCLKGHLNTPECRRMIANYWAHHQTIERIARQEGVEPALLKALIAYESHYNHKAVRRNRLPV